MTPYPLTKCALLLLSIIPFYAGTAPPRRPVEGGRIAYNVPIFEYTVRSIVKIWHFIFCSAVLSHVATLLLLRFPRLETALPVGMQTLCKSPATQYMALASLSPLFVGSLLLVVAGAGVRVWCYRTLGHQFTFEIAILKGHTLVTDGPYSLARHLSYTGACMVVLGTTLMVFAEDGYVVGCDMAANSLAWNIMVRCWQTLAPFSAFSVIRRASIEDAELRKLFGEKWEAYRRRVPYKFIPYVI
ncbi:hypothetical protein PHLGIDRAFT_225163 [Phlebiopsis gigantea 11061_1 CR5-6]|uniref:Protein-S-isoprenylcysteine O-methyltransferase n=1 Tax=Phlebiopsis gigantea (strain 11061_1 CR5-6) TaxID=745531 RepID=A0A0C3S2C9_PHLG1|nr:hypothetical protein PHLGIDRAFT_225163 [Phlebiopsis gigantea 11061_1 CR5-6]